MYEYGLENNVPVKIFSMHGPKYAAINNIYFPAEIFKGFHSARFKFITEAVNEGRKSKVVILSHINLMVVGWLIKKVSPQTKVILLAHGIEVWKPLDKKHLMMLKCCDKILSVSTFTKDKILELHKLPSEKCFVLNNCIDPFLDRPTVKMRSEVLVKRYGIKQNETVILTLTRLSLKDRYKGYGYVIESLGKIVVTNKNFKYLIAGGYEATEKIYIDELIEKHGLKDHVIVTGFIEEEELASHFSLADIYVMPSMKEGFGIVFVEAMYYGVPVIAGNADGSTDALLQGELGILINPEDVQAITEALQQMMVNNKAYLPNQQLLMDHFGYKAYKRKLVSLME